MMNLLFHDKAYCRSSSVSMNIAIVAYFGLLPTPTHVSIVCLTSQLTLLSAHPRPSRFRPDKMMKIPQNVACNLCTITTPTRLTDQVSLCTATTTVWCLLSTSDELFCSTSSLTAVPSSISGQPPRMQGVIRMMTFMNEAREGLFSHEVRSDRSRQSEVDDARHFPPIAAITGAVPGLLLLLLLLL